jgi:hypothetical protein
MAKPIAIVIDWFGPYQQLDEAKSAARKDYDDGLYMLIGKQKYEKKRRLKYVGLAKDLESRLKKDHPAISRLRECIIWLGEVATAGVSGPKRKTTEQRLDLAEWALCYFLKLPLNTKKRNNPPPQPVTLLNRWWCKDFETLRKNRPHKDWPDIIDYVGKDWGARTAKLASIETWTETPPNYWFSELFLKI